jgi:sugar O-acyltransferase (sialic acid O-acetyltransferase NeuD family)
VDERVHGEECRGLRVLAPDEVGPGGEFVIGIADAGVRRRLAALLSSGLRPATLVHPRATIAPDTTVGDGSVVLAGAYVSSSVRLGEHVQINYNATIGHDAVLEDCTTVYPGANVSGSVTLGSGATVGANAVVLQGRTVGAGAFVGAGAVVTSDVPRRRRGGRRPGSTCPDRVRSAPQGSVRNQPTVSRRPCSKSTGCTSGNSSRNRV